MHPDISVKFTKTSDSALGVASPRSTGLTLSGTDITLTGTPFGIIDEYTTTKIHQRNAVSWTVTSSSKIYINNVVPSANWLTGPTTKEMIDGTLTTKNPTDYIKLIGFYY